MAAATTAATTAQVRVMTGVPLVQEGEGGPSRLLVGAGRPVISRPPVCRAAGRAGARHTGGRAGGR